MTELLSRKDSERTSQTLCTHLTCTLLQSLAQSMEECVWGNMYGRVYNLYHCDGAWSSSQLLSLSIVTWPGEWRHCPSCHQNSWFQCWLWRRKERWGVTGKYMGVRGCPLQSMPYFSPLQIKKYLQNHLPSFFTNLFRGYEQLFENIWSNPIPILKDTATLKTCTCGISAIFKQLFIPHKWVY